MKKLIALISLLINLNAFSQNQLIGLKAGANFSNVTNNIFSPNNEFRNGIAVGITYDYWTQKHLFFGAEIIYNQLGFGNKIVFTDETGSPTGEEFKTKFNYDYISMPIKAGLKMGNKISGLINIAAVPSFLVSANIITPKLDENGKLLGADTYNSTKNVNRFDLAGMAEIGALYKIKEKYFIQASAGYFRSFTSITNSNYFPNIQINQSAFNLSIGLKYLLKGE